MKEMIKRAAALAAAALMVFSLSANVYADTTPRPRPGSEAAATQTTDTEANTDEETSQGARETAKATKAPAPVQQTTEVAGKSYTTKGGAFLWFLLSVIVNTAISLAIANRFYKLTKRQNHVQSEIRALRRDLEEKFIDNVGGFTEPNVDITNTNDDYSMEADGIRMTPASTVSVDEEEGDVYKQWEEQFGARYAARREEAQEEKSVRKYQPERESVRERLAARRAQRMEAETQSVEEAEEYSEEFDEIEEKGGISEKLGMVGNKAKELLGGIFPFDDEDEE